MGKCGTARKNTDEESSSRSDRDGACWKVVEMISITEMRQDEEWSG